MLIVYLASVPVTVKNEKAEHKEWGIFCEAVSSYAGRTDKFLHTVTGGPGIGKLCGLAQLIPDMAYLPAEKESVSVICGDDKIVWDASRINNGFSPEYYKEKYWDDVRRAFNAKKIPFSTVNFKKSGLLSNMYDDMAKNIAESRGLIVGH